MPTLQALAVWFSYGQQFVSVLAAMHERGVGGQLGLAELYDEIVIESEQYDSDPAPLQRLRRPRLQTKE